MAVIQTKSGSVFLDDEDMKLIEGFRISVTSHGYVQAQRGYCRDYLHRLVMGKPAGRVDHINRDKMDNRRANLRICGASENGCNRGRAAHNKSGFKGVYLCKFTGRFRAEIRHRGQVHKLGRYPTAAEAAVAYDVAARKLHGEFALPNFDDRDNGKVGRGCE